MGNLLNIVTPLHKKTKVVAWVGQYGDEIVEQPLEYQHKP